MSYAPDDLENHFLKDNSQKKTYVEVIQETCMQKLRDETETEPEDEQPIPKTDTADPLEMAEIHTSGEAVSPREDWEITVTTEMKRKMVGPWQTSIILKLTGR
ncbi:hypothetical protein CFP56_011486 [Quercus suber]|uniref:Uncharacterized protein n=1 Tax=Quercus suber TaxID=58331 RepID=A0AAW0M546_QUESU|nr:hypothetical protein CFP56_02312 [Quercus suber]